MRHVRIHPRTLGYLGRALSLEYSAVQQYMTQAALCAAWGLDEAAERFRHETQEELQHANRIVQRMLQLGVTPNASQLRPAGVARGLPDLLRQDAVLEAEIIAVYDEAVRFCERIAAGEDAAFFAELLGEEIEHAQQLAAWLDSLGNHPRNQTRTGANDRVYF